MSFLSYGLPAIVIAERGLPSWRAALTRFVAFARLCCERRRGRRELLDYLASDYRVAADIGITRGEACALSQRPCWRA